MRRPTRRTAAALAAATALPLTLVAAPAARAATPVTIAVIDTGVDPGHQEFGTGQITAWWDFTSERAAAHLPAPGQTWDPVVTTPYDPNGHGTITASMAAGRNVSPAKTPSFAPGTSLAIAKVGDAGGSIPGDVASAIRWAVGTAHADVINMSFGSIIPEPVLGSFDEVQTALREARAAGVLVTVANGNGNANAGVPGASGALSPYGCSPYVLSVGAAGLDGFLVHDDPEVVAQFTVTGPQAGTTNGYVTESGTSFSSPLTAGYAANLIAAGRAVGRNPRADELESVIKATARDNALVPPTYEGYGTVDSATLPAARTAATSGVVPAPNALNSLYVETIAGTQRTAACGLG
jgi:subtilisin family serine protease